MGDYMKKIISVFVLILLLASAFMMPGCRKDEVPEESTGTQGSTDTEVVFAERNYQGAEYRILCTKQCEDLYITPETQGSTVKEAVYSRNMAVQDRYAVVLNYTAMEGRSSGREAFAAEIRRAVNSGDDCYDLIIGQTYYTMALALEGMYYNMSDSIYMNMDKPWYDGELVNNNIDIAGKLYAASGSFVISQTTTVMGLYYNKTMYNNYKCSEQLGGKDIYQLVNDGEWTYEIMSGMTKLIYEDSNYNDKADKEDVYGFVGNTHAPMCALVGSDTPITTRDDNGEVSLNNYYNDHLVAVFNTYLDFFNKEKSVFYVASDEDLIDFFSNSQAMFCCNAIEYLAKGNLRDSGVDYGILPFPKYDAEQESYYSNNIRWEVAHIPQVCDTERSAIIFEYLNYTSYNMLIPAYFGTVLQYQAVNSPEDSAMLTLIRDSVRFDFATFYQSQIGKGWDDNIYIGVKSLIRNNRSDLSAWWSSNKDLFEENFEDLIDTYKYFLE